jgi:hypothetical protein
VAVHRRRPRFVAFEPVAGGPARLPTEARVLAANAIYVPCAASTRRPTRSWEAARRDNMPYSDWLIVAFDSYFDRRTAFVFVNPKGAKMDGMMYDDGRRT